MLIVGLKHFGVKFNTLNYETANKELFGLVYIENLYSINIENVETLLNNIYSEIDASCVKNKSYSLIMSKPDSPLSKYINENINEYLEVVLENCEGEICDAPEFALQLINNPDIEKSNKIAYIEYLNTEIPDITTIQEKDLWKNLFENAKSLKYSGANIIAYYFHKQEDKFDETLISYINQKGFAIGVGDLLENSKDKEQFFNALVKSITLTTEIYRDFVAQISLYYVSFDVVGLPIEKLQILDDTNKIRMTGDTLTFMRNNYKDYLIKYIVRHIQDYISLVNDSSQYVFNEILKLLNESISEEVKIKLIDLDENKTQISVKDKSYSDELSSYILENRFDPSDLDYITDNYDNFGEKSKQAVVVLAISEIETVQGRLDIISRSLLTALFESKAMDIDVKKKMLLALALSATEDELKCWLPLIKRDDFVWIFQKKSKTKNFENLPYIKKLLEIFRDRGLIENFAVDKESRKIQAQKKKSIPELV
jgi:hypothetical protein